MFSLLKRFPSALTKPKVLVKPVFTGTCPVRLRTGDGHSVGPCYHSTYEGYCPTHGGVGSFLGPDADLTEADELYFPPYDERDFGPEHVRAWIHQPW